MSSASVAVWTSSRSWAGSPTPARCPESARTCFARRAPSRGRCMRSCGRSDVPASRAVRCRSASSRTDVSALSSSRARCPHALSGLEPVRHCACVDRRAVARDARRCARLRPQGPRVVSLAGGSGRRDAGLPQRRRAVQRRRPWRHRRCSARLRVRRAWPPHL